MEQHKESQDHLAAPSGPVPSALTVDARLSLLAVNDLAKVYASSYASPHHITFTVEGLRSLIEAVRPTPSWQPIETAPKDRTEFLAWFPKLRLDDDGDATDEVVGGNQAIVTCHDGQWDEPSWLDASGAYYFDDWCFADMPTLWMPLPAPPIQLQGAAPPQGAMLDAEAAEGTVASSGRNQQASEAA